MIDKEAQEVEAIKANYDQIIQRGLEASGGRTFKVIGVSKTFAVSTLLAGYRAGLRDFGENYGDELVAKASHHSLMFDDDPIRWHFIGAIQSRKIAKLAPYVSVWHSVARAKEIDMISSLSSDSSIFIQVKMDNSPERNGVPLEVAHELVEHGRKSGITVLGLMVVPPVVDDDKLAEIFSAVNSERIRLKMDYCSMGMSEDFEVALKHGATHIRVGRALFGSRVNTVLSRELGQGGPV